MPDNKRTEEPGSLFSKTSKMEPDEALAFMSNDRADQLAAARKLDPNHIPGSENLLPANIKFNDLDSKDQEAAMHAVIDLKLEERFVVKNGVLEDTLGIKNEGKFIPKSFETMTPEDKKTSLSAAYHAQVSEIFRRPPTKNETSVHFEYGEKINEAIEAQMHKIDPDRMPGKGVFDLLKGKTIADSPSKAYKPS